MKNQIDIYNNPINSLKYKNLIILKQNYVLKYTCYNFFEKGIKLNQDK